MKKIDQQEFRIEKVIKKKRNKLYVKWQGYDSSFNSWIDKKDLVLMSQHFPKPYELFGGDINVKVDLSNYGTKTDLKNVSHVDVSSFALKSDLANLKTEVDKLDIDKLTPVPNDLAKLSNVVKNGVAKKTEYNKLVTKVDNIDTTGFVLKAKYDTDNSKIEKILKQGSGVASKDELDAVENKIPDVNNLVVKADFNSKITEVENKIPSISGLATNSALTVVENKIPDISGLATKRNYNTKTSEIEKKVSDHNHDKYVTTPEFNTLSARVFDAKLKLANLIIKKDFYTKLKEFSSRVTSNKSKHLLVENELKN